MPWSPAQLRAAWSVKSGRGGPKGFTRDFAEQVISEGVEHKAGTLGHLGGIKKKGKK